MDNKTYKKAINQLVLPEAADKRIQNGIADAISQEKGADVRKMVIFRNGARRMSVAMACLALFFVSGITVFAYNIVNHKIHIEYMNEEAADEKVADGELIMWYDIEPERFETIAEVEEYLELDNLLPAYLEENRFRMVGDISIREAENQAKLLTMEFTRGNCEMVFIEITMEKANEEGVVSLCGFEEGVYSGEETYMAATGIEWLILDSEQSSVCTEVYSKYTDADGKDILYHISFGTGMEVTLMKEIMDSISIL